MLSAIGIHIAIGKSNSTVLAMDGQPRATLGCWCEDLHLPLLLTPYDRPMSLQTPRKCGMSLKGSSPLLVFMAQGESMAGIVEHRKHGQIEHW
jgi:hypothetical protein